MTILTPSSTSTEKTFNVFLREDNIDKVILTREASNKVIEPTIVSQVHTQGYASQVTCEFDSSDLIVNNYYSMNIVSPEGNSVFRGKLYIATEQSGSVSLNTGEYVNNLLLIDESIEYLTIE